MVLRKTLSSRGHSSFDSFKLSFQPARIRQYSPFLQLPNEVLVKIFQYLSDPDDKWCIEAVCYKCCKAVRETWKHAIVLKVLFSSQGMSINEGQFQRNLNVAVLKVAAVLKRCPIESVHLHSVRGNAEHFRAAREVLELLAEYKCRLRCLCLVHVAAAEHLIPFADTLEELSIRWKLGQGAVGPESEAVLRFSMAVSRLRNVRKFQYVWTGPEPHRICLAYCMVEWILANKPLLSELHLCHTHLVSAEEIASSLHADTRLKRFHLDGCQNLKLYDLIYQRPNLFHCGCRFFVSGVHITPSRAAEVIAAVCWLKENFDFKETPEIKLKLSVRTRTMDDIILLLFRMGYWCYVEKMAGLQLDMTVGSFSNDGKGLEVEIISQHHPTNGSRKRKLTYMF